MLRPAKYLINGETMKEHANNGRIELQNIDHSNAHGVSVATLAPNMEDLVTDSLPEALTNKLILDGQKLNWHKDRVDAWLRGERIAPITIDMALTRACSYNCYFCYADAH